MKKIQGLNKLPSNYGNKLDAEHFIIGNKIKKQLNEDKSLILEEKTKIIDKLIQILGIYKKNISTEILILSNFSNQIKNNINKIEELKNRNYKGYTENDKKVMSELEEKYPEKYEDLILNNKIEFTKDSIILYFTGIGKYQYDRKDQYIDTLGKNKFSMDEAHEIAQKLGKKVVSNFHRLAEKFGNDFIVKLFQLKDGDYHINTITYLNVRLVQSSKKFGKTIKTNNKSSNINKRPDKKEVEDNYEAFVRLYKDISDKK